MTTGTGLTVQCKVHFHPASHGRKRMNIGETPQPALPIGRVPRVARLLALAIRFDGLVRRGEVRDYADLARLGHVTRARVTQIMNLLSLAPDIQDEILYLPPTVSGRDGITEGKLRPIATVPDWRVQRRMWKCLILEQESNAVSAPTAGST